MHLSFLTSYTIESWGALDQLYYLRSKSYVDICSTFFRMCQYLLPIVFSFGVLPKDLRQLKTSFNVLILKYIFLGSVNYVHMLYLYRVLLMMYSYFPTLLPHSAVFLRSIHLSIRALSGKCKPH